MRSDGVFRAAVPSGTRLRVIPAVILHEQTPSLPVFQCLKKTKKTLVNLQVVNALKVIKYSQSVKKWLQDGTVWLQSGAVRYESASSYAVFVSGV